MITKSLLALLGLFLPLWLSTEICAYLAWLSPALGPPLFQYEMLAIYPPWQVVRWWRQWGHESAWVFTVAGGGGLAFLLAIVKSRLAPGEKTAEARWASFRELRQAECLDGDGPILGTKGCWTLRYSGERHLFGVGSTGSGKTACLLSTLLATQTRPVSMVLHDPKDTLWPKTAGYRSTLGPVYRLAPLDPATDTYDPLGAIRLGTDDEYADAAILADFLTNPDGTRLDDTGQHFKDSVDMFFTGLILYGLHSGVATTGADLNDLVSCADWKDLLQVMEAFPHPAVQRSAKRAKRVIDKELSGLQSTASRATDVFSDPRVAAFTIATPTSFQLAMLREQDEPCTVYWTIPFAHQERLRPLSRLFFRQLIGYATSRVGGWQHPLRMVIDEVQSLGRLRILAEGLNFVREYGVQLWCLTPSMEELVALYGDHHPFLEGSYLQMIYGLSDPDVARHFSRRIGTHEVKTTRTTRHTGRQGGANTTTDTRNEPLFSETALLHMEEDHVLIAAGKRNVLARQARYYQRRQWRQRSLLPPPVRTQLSTPTPQVALAGNS